MRSRRKHPFQNIILMIISLLLFVFLAVFLLWNRKEENRHMQELQKEALEETAAAAADSDSQPAGEQEEGTAPEGSQNGTPESGASEPASQPQAEITGISLRGDCFVTEEEQEEKGYAAQLQKLLKKEEQELTVWDYTMSEAGSMSQMRLAGVPMPELEAYVNKHKEAADGAQLPITETKIRELSDEELVREDQQGIPVICLGYYGGWSGDLEELCLQQQRILDTYSQKEKYIILGVYPSSFEDREAYDQVMTQKWGEHYLQAQQQIDSPVLSEEGQKEIAEAVYDKMTELGYLS